MSSKATFGTGCFWCTEAIYKTLDGVIKIEPGYCGGETINPTYEDVCTGETGHAEVIQITFNSDIISYSQLIDVFWQVHDPTTLNRQGGDIGTQYRSVIFYHDEDQRKIAESSKLQIEQMKLFKDPIVTAIVEFTTFYPAENYHHNYYAINPEQSYCRMVIKPKLDKFNKSSKK